MQHLRPHRGKVYPVEHLEHQPPVVSEQRAVFGGSPCPCSLASPRSTPRRPLPALSPTNFPYLLSSTYTFFISASLYATAASFVEDAAISGTRFFLDIHEHLVHQLVRVFQVLRRFSLFEVVVYLVTRSGVDAPDFVRQVGVQFPVPC